ncbi:hypothetical protein Ancab_034374 [Ancistrocladus abbreviatus]
MSNSLHVFLFFLHLFHVSFAGGVRLLIVNSCKDSIWPGVLGTAGYSTPLDGGFHLRSGQQRWLQLPERWSGRMWARQGCLFDSTTGKGRCQTGDCAGLLQCKGVGGVPPVTVVEMTFGTSDSALHYYDVSLVDGFNIPVSMVPLGGSGGCGVAACEADLNTCCPLALTVQGGGKVVGCKSACLAMGSDRYCCTGEFASPENCRLTLYDRLFKGICPRAYSHAFDERTGLKTCRAPRYVITFCPPN